MEKFLTDRTLQELSGDIADIQSAITSGVFPALGATSANDDLNTIYSGQASRTVAFVIGQSEQNRATQDANIHFVLSVNHNANYGYQYEFNDTHIYYRKMSGGNWSTWTQII